MHACWQRSFKVHAYEQDHISLWHVASWQYTAYNVPGKLYQVSIRHALPPTKWIVPRTICMYFICSKARDMDCVHTPAGGLLEEREASSLNDIVAARLQALERSGPVWSQPTVAALLANLPLLRGAEEGAVLWLRSMARVASYRQGEVVWAQAGGAGDLPLGTTEHFGDAQANLHKSSNQTKMIEHHGASRIFVLSLPAGPDRFLV